MASGIARADVKFAVIDTAIGVCALAWSARGVTRLALPEADRAATLRRMRKLTGAEPEGAPPPELDHVVVALRAYGAGRRVDFASVKLDLGGVSAFYRRIYGEARGIRWGETATYGDLARAVGEPGAARAVGQAMGRNPVPIIIPCHRVLASGGRIGGFSAFGGAVTKQRLLALEGVDLDGRGPLLPGLLGNDAPASRR